MKITEVTPYTENRNFTQNSDTELMMKIKYF